MDDPARRHRHGRHHAPRRLRRQARARLAGRRGLRRRGRLRAPPPPLRVQPQVPEPVRGRRLRAARAPRPTAASSSSSSCDGHPFWVGTQAHPEFKSRPDRPHPLFREFVGAVAGPRRGPQPAPPRLDVDRVPHAASAPPRRRRDRRRDVHRSGSAASASASSTPGTSSRVAVGHLRGARRLDLRRATSSTTRARWRWCRCTTTAPSSLVRQYRAALDDRPARDPGRQARRRRRGPASSPPSGSWPRRSACRPGASSCSPSS